MITIGRQSREPVPYRNQTPRLRRTLYHSVVEGGLYAAMVGFGEVYFVADGVRLGASVLELGLLVSLPLLVGALGPLLALRLLRGGRTRKIVVVTGALGQVAMLLAILGLEVSGLMHPRLLIALVCGYQVAGQATGMAWASWFGDMVPAILRGRYFSRRNRVVHLVTLLALVAGGLLLQGLEPGRPGTVPPGTGGFGFVLIFSIAASARGISAWLLWRTREPRMRRPPTEQAGIRATLQKNVNARRILVMAGLLQFGVYVGTPYFGPYMLGPLSFSYAEYMAASTAMVGFKVITLLGWGRVIDQFGARAPLLLAVFLVALIPVPWLFASGIGLAILAQSFSGVAWGGHELSQFTLMLESSDAETRPETFAALNVVTGLCQLLGSLVGARLLSFTGNEFTLVFAASCLGRLAVAVAAPIFIRPSPARPDVGRRKVLLRLIGFRASGGMVHRVFFADGESAPGPRNRKKTDPPD